MKRIALLISTIGSSERDVLRGIGQFAGAPRRWVLQFQQPSTENIARLRDYRPDGIIAAVWDHAWIDQMRDVGVPIVNVADVIDDVPFPAVVHDSTAIAEMAAEYFFSRAFDRFAFVGLASERFSRRRAAAFAAVLAKRQQSCNILLMRPLKAGDPFGWRDQERQLIEWLSTLDGPVAVLASNDGRALQLIATVRESALIIPKDLAVVGIDNDELACNLCRPPLSSVQLGSERLGYEAARLLADLMAGKPPPPQPLEIAPRTIITRQSSDVLAVKDPDLAVALQYIRENANRPMRSDEVINRVAISRRSLERRFMTRLGHSILDEIHFTHIELAKQMLSHTDQALALVAQRSGFGSVRHLSILFRKLVGQTPGSYRKSHRLRE